MREVLPDLDRGPAAPGACERGGILKRALEELDREHAPGHEGARGEVEQAAENVEPVVSAITPVPGGVGAVTTAILARHVVEAAERTCR